MLQCGWDSNMMLHVQRCQPQKTTSLWFHLYKISKGSKSIKTKYRLVIIRSWGDSRMEWMLNGYAAFLWGDQCLELETEMVAWHCGCIKYHWIVPFKIINSYYVNFPSLNERERKREGTKCIEQWFSRHQMSGKQRTVIPWGMESKWDEAHNKPLTALRQFPGLRTGGGRLPELTGGAEPRQLEFREWNAEENSAHRKKFKDLQTVPLGDLVNTVQGVHVKKLPKARK